MQQLTWTQFDLAVEEITSRFASHSFIGVYGVPRGGLCFAVALSHSLSLPWLTEPKDGCLVVDDVYETGQTLRAIREKVDATFVDSTPSFRNFSQPSKLFLTDDCQLSNYGTALYAREIAAALLSTDFAQSRGTTRSVH